MRILGTIITLLFLISFITLIISFIGGKILKNEKLKNLTRKSLITSILTFILLVIVASLDKNIENKKENSELQTIETTKTENNAKSDNNVKFKGDLIVTNEDRKLKVNLNTNSPDDAIFTVFVTTSDFNALSENIIIKNGRAEQIFNIPKEWGNIAVAVSAVLTFKNNEIKQSEKVKEFFKNEGVTLETKTIDIPSKEIVQQTKENTYQNTKKELIKASNGLILKIEEFQDENRVAVIVIFDNIWYQIEKYEKEEIVNTLDPALKNLVASTKNISPDKVFVFYKNRNSKNIVNRTMFGKLEILELIYNFQLLTYIKKMYIIIIYINIYTLGGVIMKKMISDFEKYLKENLKKVNELAAKNEVRDLNGRICIAKDDEWKDENEWEESTTKTPSKVI